MTNWIQSIINAILGLFKPQPAVKAKAVSSTVGTAVVSAAQQVTGQAGTGPVGSGPQLGTNGQPIILPSKTVLQCIYDNMFAIDPLKRFFVIPAKYAPLLPVNGAAVAGDLFTREVATLSENDALPVIYKALQENIDPKLADEFQQRIETEAILMLRELVFCELPVLQAALLNDNLSTANVRDFLYELENSVVKGG